MQKKMAQTVFYIKTKGKSSYGLDLNPGIRKFPYHPNVTLWGHFCTYPRANAIEKTYDTAHILSKPTPENLS